MHRYKFTLEDRKKGGSIAGTKSKESKTGIYGMTPEQRHAAAVLGGLITGPKLAAANKASGLWDRIRNSPEAVERRLKWARSQENKARLRKMAQEKGPVDMDAVRTLDGCKKGAEIGGPVGRHVRWHVSRRLLNPLCPLCIVAKERGDSWWTAVYSPKR